MEISEAKNPYDIFFKCHNLDESSIPEHVMFDMMDLWEVELWDNCAKQCSLFDVNDVACFAGAGRSVRVFDSIAAIDTSKPIASVFANLTKQFYDHPDVFSQDDWNVLYDQLKGKAELSVLGHWGSVESPSLHLVHPLGYVPHNSEWVLVSYQ